MFVSLSKGLRHLIDVGANSFANTLDQASVMLDAPAPSRMAGLLPQFCDLWEQLACEWIDAVALTANKY
ncbi:MAG: hypothetical protein JWP80_3865 [Pseudomonas sp.]|nr:hypothetical protein [Pseudomonas sp.]